MGLVDYSESDSSGSEAEAPVKAPSKASSTTKKPFQKVVDRSNPGKIIVNLPQPISETKPDSDEPPTKRARTGGAGGGLFSGLNSFLPPPKNANKPAGATGSSSRVKPGVNLRTSAAPGFSRDVGESGDGAENAELPTGGLNLPPPKAPSIPAEQKAEEDVKLVGKPLMFKPLSVSRNPQKKKKKTTTATDTTKPTTTPSAQPSIQSQAKETETEAAGPAPAPAPKKLSLFSMHTEETSEPRTSSTNGTYEPLFATTTALSAEEQAYQEYARAQTQTGPSPTTGAGSNSVGNIANDLNLSAADRRALFGRGGGGELAAKNVINFNMDHEYQHNEELRAAGEQQIHNPVRAIQGGKHSLRQLVQNVHNQREALEDSFAKGKSNRKEASSRYGW